MAIFRISEKVLQAAYAQAAIEPTEEAGAAMDEIIGLIPEGLTDKQEADLAESITTYGEAMQRGGFFEGFRRALLILAKKLTDAKKA